MIWVFTHNFFCMLVKMAERPNVPSCIMYPAVKCTGCIKGAVAHRVSRFPKYFVFASLCSFICDRAWEKGPCRANNDFSV